MLFGRGHVSCARCSFSARFLFWYGRPCFCSLVSCPFIALSLLVFVSCYLLFRVAGSCWCLLLLASSGRFGGQTAGGHLLATVYVKMDSCYRMLCSKCLWSVARRCFEFLVRCFSVCCLPLWSVCVSGLLVVPCCFLALNCSFSVFSLSLSLSSPLSCQWTSALVMHQQSGIKQPASLTY